MGRERYSTKGKGKDRRITGHKSSIEPRGGKEVELYFFFHLGFS